MVRYTFHSLQIYLSFIEVIRSAILAVLWLVYYIILLTISIGYDREVYLFGGKGPLQLNDDSTFPVVQPVTISEEDDVVIGGQSFGFIVFPDAKVAQCA